MKRLWSAIVGAGIAIVVVLACWFIDAVFYSTADPAIPQVVEIARGTDFSEIASQLARAGVISNALTFRIWGKLQHLDTDVRAGEYRFAAHVTQDEVLRELQSGGAQVARWVTIPEGFTAKQIAQRLEAMGFGSAAAFDDAFMHQTIVVDGTRTKNLEGYLFPSTYLIAVGSTPSQIIDLLTGQFFKELPPDAAARAKAMHLTVPQVVTVASLIEREAKIDPERPIMAGVYYNRLRIGMPLQVDASIEYALPQYQTELSFNDLKIDSPFNSYTHLGLPPTPIANPGEASLEAAFHPAKTEYLYYVYKGDGHHAFAKTLEEHNANVARYEK